MKRIGTLLIILICFLQLEAKTNYSSQDSIRLEECQLDVVNSIIKLMNLSDDEHIREVKRNLRYIRLYRELVKNCNDSSMIHLGNYNFLANTYFALSYQKQRQFDSAFTYAQKAYTYYIPYGKKICIHDYSETLWNSVFGDDGIFAIIRDYYMKEGQIDKALEQSKMMADSCKVYCSYLTTARVLDSEGDLYVKKKDYYSSIKTRRDALMRRLYVSEKSVFPQASMIYYNILDSYISIINELVRADKDNSLYIEEITRYIHNILCTYNPVEIVEKEIESGSTLCGGKLLTSLFFTSYLTKKFDSLIENEENIKALFNKHFGVNSCEYADILLLLANTYKAFSKLQSDSSKSNDYALHSNFLLSDAARIWLSDSLQSSIINSFQMKDNTLPPSIEKEKYYLLNSYNSFLSEWCNYCLQNSRLKEAEKWIKQSILLTKNVGGDKCTPYIQLSHLYKQKKNYKKALYHSRQALTYAIQQKDTIGMINSYISLSKLYEVYTSIPNYANLNETNLTQAYLLIQQYDSHKRGIVDIMQKMAEMYSKRYKYDYAEELMSSSLIIKEVYFKEPISDEENVKLAQYIHDRYGILVPTEPLFIKIKQIANKGYKNKTTIDACALLGGYYGLYGLSLHSKDSIEKSTYYFEKAIEIARELKDSKSLAHLLLCQCDIYYINENYSKALGYALESEKLNSRNIPPEIFCIASRTPNVELVESRLSSFLHNVKDTLLQKLLYTDVDGREFLLRKYNLSYRIMGSMAYYYPESTICSEIAYNTQLLMKGLLVQTQKHIGKAIEESKNKTLENDYAKYLNLRKQLKKNSYGIDLNDENALLLGIQIFELEKKIANEIISSNLNCDLNISWQDVRKHLDKKEVAIEFVEINNFDIRKGCPPAYYGALILRKDYSSPKFVTLGLKTEIDKHINDISNIFNNTAKTTQKRWQSLSRQLYDFIWAKLEDYISLGDKIYFSAAGMLHQAPIEILCDKDGHIVNEKYSIFRLSSTKELCKKEKHSLSSIALYGGLIYDDNIKAKEVDSVNAYHYKGDSLRSGWQYLPSTAIEVNHIATLLDSANIRTMVQVGHAGTERSFRKLSGKNISILHIATHGFYFGKQDVRSLGYYDREDKQYISSMQRAGLMMSGGQAAWLGTKSYKQDEDGILLAEEIANLDFKKTNIVVLSACQTGLGDIDNSGEGVYGIQRAFKLAGVKTLVMTLGKVDDAATQLFMKSFYSSLISGLSTYESFQKAQSYVRNYEYEYNGYKMNYSNPKYWAPFILLDANEN